MQTTDEVAAGLPAGLLDGDKMLRSAVAIQGSWK